MNVWGYHSPTDYLTAAQASSSADELAFLAGSEYEFVRLAVAQNPNVTSSILLGLVPEEFATWNQQQLAGLISENQKAPTEALQKIAVGLRPFLDFARGNEMAGEAVIKFCHNPAVPLEIIKQITEPTETSPRIRRKIANKCARRDVLELLLTDPSEAVRSRARRALDAIE